MKENTYPQPKCPRCGKELEYVPNADSWYCEKCKTYPPIQESTRSSRKTPSPSIFILIILMLVGAFLTYLYVYFKHPAIASDSVFLIPFSCGILTAIVMIIVTSIILWGIGNHSQYEEKKRRESTIKHPERSHRNLKKKKSSPWLFGVRLPNYKFGRYSLIILNSLICIGSSLPLFFAILTNPFGSFQTVDWMVFLGVILSFFSSIIVLILLITLGSRGVTIISSMFGIIGSILIILAVSLGVFGAIRGDFVSLICWQILSWSIPLLVFPLNIIFSLANNSETKKG